MYLPITGYWDRVIFSDESKVETGLDSRVYIWRKVGKERQPDGMAPPPERSLVSCYGGAQQPAVAYAP